MAAPPNVVRRGRLFHFRRVVPADLRGRLQRREFVRMLGACSRGQRGCARTNYIGSLKNFSREPAQIPCLPNRPSRTGILQLYSGEGAG
ncbi:DUF6538 domain-containing protein [Shinella zoogloeoides]|uniref:DUF6538 domain-containing protein n=1 Tax=Shinella zoogloeoides TaxID=352475 RepID=UPI003C78A85F